MKRWLKRQIRLFSRLIGRNQWLPVKELTVDDYCQQYYSTYSAPKTIIYQKELRSEIPPRTIEKEISWKFRSLYTRMELEAFVLVLDNGRVYGSNGAIITRENILLRDISREFGNRHHHSLMNEPFLRSPKHINGVVAVLTTAGANTYYHWMFDILPRFHLIQQAGLLDKVDHFVIPPIKQAFQKETLTLLPVDPAKWIEADENMHIEADTIIAPSLPSNLGTIAKWASDYVANELGKKIDTQMPEGGKIYVSRAAASARRLINEAEVIDFLINNGFQIIEAEKYSFAEQVSLFRNANIVIAPHGSGLANTVFCREGATIIDIFSSDFVVPCFWSLANNCNLYYYCIYSGEADNLFFRPYWAGEANDFTIDIKKIQQSLTIKTEK